MQVFLIIYFQFTELPVQRQKKYIYLLTKRAKKAADMNRMHQSLEIDGPPTMSRQYQCA